MSPSMDDRRILAEMERRLSRDDPELVSLIDALNHQFPDDQDDTDRRDDDEQRSWRRKVLVAFIVLALLGLILTALFTKPPPADDNQRPPHGLAPVATLHTRHRVPRSRTHPEAKLTRRRRGTIMASTDTGPCRVKLAVDGHSAGPVPCTPRDIGSGGGPSASVRRRW